MRREKVTPGGTVTRLGNGVAALVLALFAALPLPSSVRAATPKLGGYYVAIGDSFSLGYLAPGIPVDAQCQATGAPGFVCIFYHYLRSMNPAIKVQNFSQSGADSCLLAQGHQCYDPTPAPNPLDSAISFVHAHPGQISPITVTIGGDDLLHLLPQAARDPVGTLQQLPRVLTVYHSNLDVILSRLRSAAPDAQIIVTTQPNPMGGMKSPPLPPGLPVTVAGAVNALNTVMRTEAPKYNAVVADSARAFDANPGGSALLTFAPASLAGGDLAQFNPYPTHDGYRTYGGRVIADSGYSVPLTLSFHLAKTNVPPGNTEHVVGSTSSGSEVTAAITLPGATHRTVRDTASDDGSFSLVFRVGKLSGTGSLHVCVTDVGGTTICRPHVKFSIRRTLG